MPDSMTAGKSDRADFVVVGAGIAGLTAAIRAAEAGCSVVILNKGPAWRADRAEQSTSFYAQGGVAVVTVEDPLDPGIQPIRSTCT